MKMDMSATIAPKSNQLNADDLIAGPRTITVTKVSANPESAEQPVAISFQGDNGKPFFPCKTIRRVLVSVWGKDASEYVGRSMTLYRDPEVQFGGMKVGGIRVSHMSHIDSQVTMAMTATRSTRKPYTVKPLRLEQPKQAASELPPLSTADALRLAEAAANRGTEHFREWFNSGEGKECRATNALTPDEMARLKIVCSRADKPADEADPFGLPPIDRASTATDGEITDAMQAEAEEAARRHAEEQARLAGAA